MNEKRYYGHGNTKPMKFQFFFVNKISIHAMDAHRQACATAGVAAEAFDGVQVFSLITIYHSSLNNILYSI